MISGLGWKVSFLLLFFDRQSLCTSRYLHSSTVVDGSLGDFNPLGPALIIKKRIFMIIFYLIFLKSYGVSLDHVP